MLLPPPYMSLDSARRLVLDPSAPTFVRNPYEAYEWLHANAPAFHWAHYGIWCFAAYEDVNRLLRDRRLGRERPGGYMAFPESARSREHLAAFDAIEASSMLEVEPPVHTRLRTLVNRAFVSRQVERLRPRIEALANELIDRIEPAGEADLISVFATPIPIVLISEMLGVPTEMGPQLLDWSHRMVRMYLRRRDRAIEEDANAAAAAFSDFVLNTARLRRKAPGDDLLSVLVSSMESGDRLSEQELVSSTILLLNAGHEATVHQIGNAVATILQQAGDPRRFFADAVAPEAVEECLRIDPPLHLFKRYVYEDIDLPRGVRAKRGEQIGLLLAAANRDPSAFDRPEAFEPGRADQKNVSFGAGIHFCIGAPLARLELQIALKVLFDRLPSLRLTQPPRYRDSFHFRGLERLDVAW